MIDVNDIVNHLPICQYVTFPPYTVSTLFLQASQVIFEVRPTQSIENVSTNDNRAQSPHLPLTACRRDQLALRGIITRYTPSSPTTDVLQPSRVFYASPGGPTLNCLHLLVPLLMMSTSLQCSPSDACHVQGLYPGPTFMSCWCNCSMLPYTVSYRKLWSKAHRELKFICTWDTRPSREGSRLLFQVIKANTIKICSAVYYQESWLSCIPLVHEEAQWHRGEGRERGPVTLNQHPANWRPLDCCLCRWVSVLDGLWLFT